MNNINGKLPSPAISYQDIIDTLQEKKNMINLESVLKALKSWEKLPKEKRQNLLQRKLSINDSDDDKTVKKINQINHAIGLCFSYGIALDKNHQKAFEYFLLAANKGHILCQYNVGLYYWTGTVCAKDHSKAFKYFLLSAEQGDAEAQYYVGAYYSKGINNEQNLKAGFDYYQRSANQGYKWGLLALGACYEEGRGVEQNDQKAFECFQLAADQGLAEAQFCVGIYYVKGRGVEQNDRKAFEYFELAANQGVAKAQSYLGVCYAQGQVIEQNDRKAFEYFELAANQGDAVAQSYLGVCYAKGQVVEQNERKAFNFFNQLIENPKNSSDFQNVITLLSALIKNLNNKNRRIAEKVVHLRQFIKLKQFNSEKPSEKPDPQIKYLNLWIKKFVNAYPLSGLTLMPLKRSYEEANL